MTKKYRSSTQMTAAMIALQSGIPTILWGKPGTGKTSWINLVSETLGYHTETVIASIREPADFAGLPVIQSDGSVALATPNWATRIIESERDGLLFLDEISTAPPAVQAALLRVVFERAVGDTTLPENTKIIAAANPTSTSGGTWTLSSALANRFVHLDWGIEPKTWVEGMMNGWQTESNVVVLPENWKDEIQQAVSLVTSFIHHRPALLINQPEDIEAAGGAWASPRSWENGAILLGACDSVGADNNVKLMLLVGTIGKGAATEFLHWVNNLDLQNPADLLKNPDSFVLPSTGDKVFATLSAVVAEASTNLTKHNWEAAWDILGKAAKGNRADIAAIPVKTLAKARGKHSKLAIPMDIREFVPILRAAGLLSK